MRDALNIENCRCGGTAHLQVVECGFCVRCERDPGLASAPVYTTPRRAINAWNEAQESMDVLATDAVCAYHTGTSYGQYIAQQPKKIPEERYPKKKTEANPVLELRCIHCGMLIPPECRSRKYCSEVCADRYREKQARIRKKLAKEIAAENPPEREKRYCLLCANLIPPESGRFRYCSALCATKARYIQSKEYHKQQRKARKQ